MVSKELVKYSLKNLWHRKARSFLTILSIFAGITTIFIFISFGLGLYGYVNDLSSSSSADKLIIQAKGMGAPGTTSTIKLTEKDLDTIIGTSGVFEATGIYVKPAEILQGKTKRYSFLLAYDPKKPLMIEFLNVKVSKGRMLTGKDSGNVVLGYNYQIPDKIMPKGYELNGNIEIQGKKLRIIGFLESIGNPQDDSQIYVSNEYFKELYGNNESFGMIIARADISKVYTVIDNVEKGLRKSRGVEKGKEDFFVQSFDDLINTYASALNLVIGFVVLIALISVLVSAINTSNTMITSVLERIKEIGIMKSIGARNSDIFSIYLFESGFLGFVAGVLGVIAGWGFTYVAHIILDFYGWGFLSPNYSAVLFIGCVIFATLTGAISGVIPAYNAAKTNPVVALRYE